jgi:hypothetical protein
MNLIEKNRRLLAYMRKIKPENTEEMVQRHTSTLEWAGGVDIAAILSKQPGDSLSSAESSTLEALILPKERPVIDIVNDRFTQPPDPFGDLFTDPKRKQNILDAIPCVGRIGVPGLPQYPFAGTGFIVGEELLMTNRHVAELVCNGLGTKGLSFRAGQEANIVDFRKEAGADVAANSKTFRITDIVMIHPYWDMALFRTVGLAGIGQLTLSTAQIGSTDSNEIVVIGYPAFDPRNNTELQMQLFRKIFNVKRLQPGKVNGLAPVNSFNKTVNALAHDASTLGGNSGSVVLNTQTGLVEGLHFSGVYLLSNYAVPAFALARDGHVTAAGVKVDSPVATMVGPWDDYWKSTAESPVIDNKASTNGAAKPPLPITPVLQTPACNDPYRVSFTVPLEISVRIAPALSSFGAATPVATNGAVASEAVDVPSTGFPAKTTAFPSSPIEEIPSNRVGSFDWLQRKGFDLELAVFLAQASQAAYGDEEMTGAWAVAQGFTTTRFFNRGNIQGFWCSAEDTALLVFRGTSNPGQWLRDAKFLAGSHPWGTVHVGFRDGLAAVEPDLLAFDPVASQAKNFWICGHSLGGALAVLASARSMIRKITTTPSIYTYGQPRVGFCDFADTYGVNLPRQLYRFVNQQDIVTRVPPGLYQHCGLVKRIVRPGQLESMATMEIPQMVDHDAPPCSDQEFAQVQADLAKASAAMALESIDIGSYFPFIHDHYIGEYIRLLTDIKNAGPVSASA